MVEHDNVFNGVNIKQEFYWILLCVNHLSVIKKNSILNKPLQQSKKKIYEITIKRSTSFLHFLWFKLRLNFVRTILPSFSQKRKINSNTDDILLQKSFPKKKFPNKIEKSYSNFRFSSIIFTQNIFSLSKSHISYSNCDSEQHLLYTDLCDMDDIVDAT